MKLTLKDFQEEKVAELAVQGGLARSEVEAGGSPQTLVLAAPTGSGKTMMATAFMEGLVEGDEKRAADPTATFLWLTDQPELNEQTRRKFEATSTVFGSGELVTIESDFNASLLTPGRVYFLNTQKLGKDNKLVTVGDERTHLIWETFANTAEHRPGSFWVIVDEAHKGMAESKKDRDLATTIVQKFIKGSPDDGLPQMPLVLGISATPERFQRLLEGLEDKPRINRPVTVTAESVRASGLLKDAITLYHPKEKQPADLTMLNGAAGKLVAYEGAWAEYADKESATEVRPLLVVQVEDAGAKSISKTDLGQALKVIEEILGPLGTDGVAHSFQEGHAIALDNDRAVRYIGPADIQGEEALRVVFFKRSLNTGWDCPRAEVLASFRRQVDETLIAQLVGRMVRTPLARRVAFSDFLNSVVVWLPFFDEKAVTSVIKRLADPDPEVGFPTKVQRGEKLMELDRNPACATAFSHAKKLDTYVIETVSKQSAARRILRLGRLLAWDKLDEAALDVFTRDLVEVLEAERKKVANNAKFKARVEQAALIDVRAVTVELGETVPSSTTSSKLAALTQNVEHAFADAGRRLGGGLHLAYLHGRVAAPGAPAVATVKCELYALLENPDVLKKVEDKATRLLAKSLEEHKAAVMDLPDERRQLYRQVRRQAKKPEPEPWELPPSIEASKNGGAYERHLYADAEGLFSCKLNTWEAAVIEEELAKEDVVGWLRNEPRKLWSFAVPYSDGKEDRPHYPDFLVFRKLGKGLVCDVLEPHSLGFADSPAKAAGLAEFAHELGDQFGRIELIAKVGKDLKRLPLHDIETRDKVRGVKTKAHLNQLFEAA